MFKGKGYVQRGSWYVCGSTYTHPPVLTTIGGQQNTYGWQAGGTHSTGKISCYSVKVVTESVWYWVCIKGCDVGRGRN